MIEWLGAYYIDSKFCEKAIHYFERASIVQYVYLEISTKGSGYLINIDPKHLYQARELN